MDDRPPPKPSRFYRSGVTARVKWFSPEKGFGFVTPDDGSPDAFLHASAVRDAGVADLPAGATVVCDLSQGAKGPQVALLHSVDPSTVEPRPARGGRRPPAGRPPRTPLATAASPRPPAPRRSVEGTVRFFDPRKGYGFVVPDDGGKDIYLGLAALKRSGLEALQPRVRVRVQLAASERGVEAERVEFL